MRIAYLIGPTVAGHSNGIIRQAKSWANGLTSLGHQVELINPWGSYHWNSFEIIHLFGTGTWLDIVPHIAARTKAKLALSPIMDTNRHHITQRAASHCGIKALRMTSPLYALRKIQPYVTRYFARSEHERNHIAHSFNIKDSAIEIVKLSHRFAGSCNPNRDDFCLHVSILSSPNKNVTRLIHAAMKYKFRLVLAGSPGTDNFRRELLAALERNPNIEYHGFIHDEQLVELYSRAKVFALPAYLKALVS